MKIALVSQPLDAVLPPNQNSLGIWIYQVARRLAREHELVIYTRGGRLCRRVEQHEGLTVVKVPMLLDAVLLRVLRRLGRWRPAARPIFATHLYYLGYALQVALDVRRRGPDLVQILNFSQFVPLIRALNPATKIVLHMHCEWLSQFAPDLIGPRLRHVGLIIGCSEHIAGQVRLRFPALAGRTAVVYNGVDAEQFTAAPRPACLPERPRRLLFVGRVSPEKGLHVLIAALGQLRSAGLPCELEIVGSQRQLSLAMLRSLGAEPAIARLERFYQGAAGDAYFNHLQQQVQAAGLGGQVRFVAARSHAELVTHYRDCDLLINPSLSEAFGMSLVEAMACRRPVVATAVGGMVEIVEPGVTGLLVPPDNPQALAEAIRCLLDDGNGLAAMGEAGRQRVLEHFAWERVVGQLEQQYERMGAAGPLHPTQILAVR